ncbi:hypothetical protein AK812_SmicGene48181 [Symbiodinium microadriaticum]|uniref:Uncharacterized protein n=1 Tax=Symbiodinium microadriaticum TaxID=2951 RepID=A0A1Q9BQ95_SYMMI|nr:hypothetical protein AK812_SmicGene48181 [Symbiodinium microadriaticum]
MATRTIRKKCPHGRQRHLCPDCGGAGICQHRRQKHNCRECGGSNFCEHGRHKHHCRACSSSFCEHGRQKWLCRDCGGGGICEHGRQKHNCRDCGGSSFCEHGRRRLVSHMRAFHGDNPKGLTKSKELEVHQLLAKSGIQFEYQHHLPFRGCGLESETTRAFADFVLYAPWGAIILEVDEHQHSHQDPSCDVRRD